MVGQHSSHPRPSARGSYSNSAFAYTVCTVDCLVCSDYALSYWSVEVLQASTSFWREHSTI